VPRPRLPRIAPSLALPLVLLLLLAAVNALAVAGIVAASRSARASAVQELQLQTQAQARALEAVLSSLRRELVFLVRSPALVELVAAGPQPSEAARRRAADELLHFAQEHGAVRALALRDRQGAPLALTGRSARGPTLLPVTSDPPAPIAERTLFVTQVPVAGRLRDRGLLEVWIEPRVLLADVAPTLGDRLEVREAGSDDGPAAPGRLVAHASVRDALWSPPVAWTLVRREAEGQALDPVTELAARYQRTVLLNAGVMLLTLVLGALAFRQARRGAALEAENRQQARMRELERQVLHAERLASIGRLAAGVAHEVNNPLEGMSNYLSLLEEDLASGDVERARHMVPRVREGLARVAGVTRQMLAFSDPARAPKEPIDLRRPLEETVEFVRQHPAFRGVDLRLALPPEPLTVRGSATTLGQLFLNLLLNAAQNQQRPAQQGAEAKSAAEVEISCGTVGDLARVTVADRGPGLSKDALDHLFEPFFSTRGSTGLGLAACHGIARDHNGSLRGRNRASGGAEFVLELPLEREAVPQPDAGSLVAR
jgi:signal transduction histidine kinase